MTQLPRIAHGITPVGRSATGDTPTATTGRRPMLVADTIANEPTPSSIVTISDEARRRLLVEQTPRLDYVEDV